MSATIPPPADFSNGAHVGSLEAYRELHAKSVADPEAFWAGVAERISWKRKWDNVLDWGFAKGHIRWFEGATLNVSENCLDRHVAAGHGDRVALIWESDEPGGQSYTYAGMLEMVCRWANVLKDQGVKRGDRVCLYLPMVIDLPAAMLACARIGAVHSVVFAGFSADSLRDRILDAECSVLVTADEGMRGGRAIPLKKISDKALEGAACCTKCLLVKRTGADVNFVDGRDVWMEPLLAAASTTCEPEEMDAEDPLFILYTSGSTGKPKGVLHTTGGYITYASYTHEMVFDWKPEDIYWCAADIGWITGHSYIVYGPLCEWCYER